MIETGRLYIIPLTYEHLLLYLRGEDRLENLLGLAHTGRVMDARVCKDIEQNMLPKIRSSRDDLFLFHTCWLVIDKASMRIVAELGFKGEPNRNKEVEIGYGTIQAMRGKGYMTEAVRAMIGWASARQDVDFVLAETSRLNTASIRVMQKNNFECFQQLGSMLWWRMNVQQSTPALHEML